jgi:hypothetical protein
LISPKVRRRSAKVLSKSLHDILQRLAHELNPPPEQLRPWLPDHWKPPPKTEGS